MEKNDGEKARLIEELERKTFPKFLGKWNEILERNGGFLVGKKKVLYADLNLASHLQIYEEVFQNKMLKSYPALLEHQSRILSLPGIKEWIAKRPKSLW